MQTGKGKVLELILADGFHHVRVFCTPNLIPSPGQYLLAGDGSDAPLPVPLFHTDSASQGFIAAGLIPNSWNPGTELYLRGPLGQGFSLPLSARKVGLVALDVSPARLKGLIQPALRQEAAVVLVCNSSVDHLPDDVEVHPMSALQEIVEWADYLAFDVEREQLNLLTERWGKQNPVAVGKARVEFARKEAQVLIHTAMPCGGVAECGACAVILKSGWKLACKDGPVFAWRDILE
jgi:NAD(P)H-flavin reductase